jgi:integrase
MSAFKRRGGTVYQAKVYDRSTDEWVTRTLATRDAVLKNRMQAMLDQMHPMGKRAWEILDAIVEYRFTVPEVFDLYLEEGRDVERVRARMEDVNLEPYVAEWLKNPGGRVKPGSDSAKHYEHHVRALIPKGERFTLHEFTSARVQQHIEELVSKPATKRKAGAAISSFAKWLFRRGIMKVKPMRDVELPAAGPPRIHFIETPDAIRLADAQPGQYRAYSATIHGSGIEVSVALGLRPRDIDRKHHEARAPGTKAYTRDRIARIADWAWPYLEPLLEGKHPDARIFDQIPDRWKAADAHNDAVDALVEKGHTIYAGYTMRDARHTWAVRAIKAGMPVELVARQMGHVDGTLVLKVYGRFVPKQAERQRWEEVAAAADKEAIDEAKKQREGKA